MENSKGTGSTNDSHRRSYYYNGIYVGNIYYRTEAFDGIINHAEELKADIEERFDDFTSELNFSSLFIVHNKKR